MFNFLNAVNIIWKQINYFNGLGVIDPLISVEPGEIGIESSRRAQEISIT